MQNRSRQLFMHCWQVESPFQGPDVGYSVQTEDKESEHDLSWGLHHVPGVFGGILNILNILQLASKLNLCNIVMWNANCVNANVCDAAIMWRHLK